MQVDTEQWASISSSLKSAISAIGIAEDGLDDIEAHGQGGAKAVASIALERAISHISAAIAAMEGKVS